MLSMHHIPHPLQPTNSCHNSAHAPDHNMLLHCLYSYLVNTYEMDVSGDMCQKKRNTYAMRMPSLTEMESQTELNVDIKDL